MGEGALRIGTVAYLNSLPLTSGIEGLVREVPSALAERFRAGDLDVALLPVVEALRMPECPRLPGMGVCSPGPVDSVVVLSRGPIEDEPRIVLDRSSRTSNALCRLLFAEWLDGSPEFVGSAFAVSDATLLIGDKALIAPRRDFQVHDLATLWRRHTGLSFCFALWVARDEASAARALPVLEAALARGLPERGRFARAAAAAGPLSEERYLTYLTERITYVVGEEEERAIALFERLLSKHALL